MLFWILTVWRGREASLFSQSRPKLRCGEDRIHCLTHRDMWIFQQRWSERFRCLTMRCWWSAVQTVFRDIHRHCGVFWHGMRCLHLFLWIKWIRMVQTEGLWWRRSDSDSGTVVLIFPKKQMHAMRIWRCAMRRCWKLIWKRELWRMNRCAEWSPGERFFRASSVQPWNWQGCRSCWTALQNGQKRSSIRRHSGPEYLKSQGMPRADAWLIWRLPVAAWRSRHSSGALYGEDRKPGVRQRIHYPGKMLRQVNGKKRLIRSVYIMEQSLRQLMQLQQVRFVQWQGLHRHRPETDWERRLSR